MKIIFTSLATFLLFAVAFECQNAVQAAEDPTLYQHYTSGGIKAGLNASTSAFTLNEKSFTIFGGSFHYFRYPKKNCPKFL